MESIMVFSCAFLFLLILCTNATTCLTNSKMDQGNNNNNNSNMNDHENQLDGKRLQDEELHELNILWQKRLDFARDRGNLDDLCTRKKSWREFFEKSQFWWESLRGWIDWTCIVSKLTCLPSSSLKGRRWTQCPVPGMWTANVGLVVTSEPSWKQM